MNVWEHELGGGDALFERCDALDAVARLTKGLVDGRGGSLFIIGDAGLGKTTLLRRTEHRTALQIGPCVVGRSEGVLFGSSRPFRLADQLFASLGLDVRHQASGPHGETRRSNRFLSAIRALDSFSRHMPVLLLLDDLHWCDSDSLALVEFVCRQAHARAVGVIATLRPWPAETMEAARRLESEGSASVCELRPLSADASVALMAQRVWGEVPTEDIEHATTRCGGNPLLIEEVARSLTGGSKVPVVEPFSTARRAILLRRFAGVSDETFRFLRNASVLGATFRPVVAARMVGFDARDTDRALEEASSAGLVETVDQVARFIHPLFEATLYEGLQTPLRNELHEAAFRAIRFVGGGEGEAAEHALIAGLTDKVAISSIREAGLQALRSGAWASAVRFLGYAVATAGPAATSSMVRQHAEALAGAGSAPEAVSRLEELLARPDMDDLEKGRALVVLGQARVASGSAESTLECFEEAAGLLEPSDRAGAVDALLRGANVGRLLVGPRTTMDLAERARSISGDLSRAVKLQIDAAWGSGAFMLGDMKGLDLLGESVAVIESEPGLIEEFSDSGWWPILWWMSACTFTERFDEAQQAFELGFCSAEEMGWPAVMGAYLISHILLKVRVGELDAAEEDLTKLKDLSSLVAFLGPFRVVAEVALDLELGRVAEAEKGCEQLETLLGMFDIPLIGLWTSSIRGRLEVYLGRLPEASAAFERCEQIADSLEIREPCVTPWWMSAIEGYTAARRFDDLTRVVSMLDRATAGIDCRAPKAASLAGKGFLAEADGDATAAAALFTQAAATLDGAGMPIVRAEVLGWQGGVLHRQGEIQAARRVLSEAFQLAASHRAGLLAFKARSQLRDAGGRVRRKSRQPGGLTPRQAQVADMASNGSTISR